MGKRKIGRKKGGRKKGYYFRSGRGWYAVAGDRSVPPIFHKCDQTIRGHVFCGFLALLLRKELQDRLEAQGDMLEWAELLRDLKALA